MFEKVIAVDKQLFIFLNGLGSENYDNLWLAITNQCYWLPFYFVVFYFLRKKTDWKNLLIILLFIGVLIAVCDQTANLFKESVQRLRPCNDPEIKSIIRIVKSSDTFSFFSGHAANSMATMTFIYLILKRYYRLAFLVFIFPLIFAYSRIYLGLHFPLDILTGYAFGAAFGGLFYKLHQYFHVKYFSEA